MHLEGREVGKVEWLNLWDRSLYNMMHYVALGVLLRDSTGGERYAAGARNPAF